MPRVTVDIDGTTLSAREAHYVVSRAANQQGLRVADSMRAKAYFYADIMNSSENPQDSVINFWKMATDKEDPLHSVTITYYKTDTEVLNTAKFKGWITVFETLNPPLGLQSGANSGNMGTMGTGASMASEELPGNLLYCELAVVLDKENLPNHRFTK